MKRITIFLAFLLCAIALFAQAPEKFTYQAVVRNASNSLVANAPVGVRVSILQGSASGNAVYMELHTATTNANGLLTLEIGGGTAQQGTFADIDWANGSFFLKTEIDPNGGANYSITNTQQMLSVPYALYSKEAGNGFSGDYNDLTNLPQIPQIPENVSAFNNDAGYITMDSVPTIPTNVSAFTNDAGYLTSFTEQQILTISNDTIFLTGGSFVKLPEGFDGDYNSLTNTPTIPTVPVNVSAFTNDAGYLTSFTEQQVLSISNDTIFLTGGSFVKLPEGFDGDYNSLTNTPTIPTVPANVSAFTNDAGYLTSFTEQQVLTISNDTIFLTGGSFVKLPDGFDGDYNSLINQPVIPTVPTVVSAFTNDAGYITKDSVPTIPTVVSAFTNDAGYLTGYIETQTLSDVTAIGNSAGSRQLKDVSDPTEAYDAVNLRTLTLLMDSLRNTFQQQLQQLQQQMQQQIDSLQEIVNALDTNHHTDNFVCGTSTLTDYEGNVYATVQIGNQCWMRDNLRTTHYADGTAIPLDSSYTSSAEPYYYDYSSSIIPLTQRGYLYNWPAVMRGASSSSANPSGVQGICPAGWHVPSDAEWTQLTAYVSSQSDYLCSDNAENIAKVLASTTGWSSSSSMCAVGNHQDLNNSTGFGAIPAGYHYNLGFTNSGKYAYFWSSTEASSGNSWYRSFNYNYAYVYRNNYGKHFGYSVRCLRDENGGGGTVQTQPTVATGEATDIASTSATLNGTISNPDNVTITAQGFEWKTAEDSNYTTVNASGETMSYNLTGLTANTGYSYRAFVTTAEGTGYGEEVSFTTLTAEDSVVVDEKSCSGTPTVTDYEGNEYATVQIGNQCWMRENIRSTHYSDGTAIAAGSDTSATEAYYYTPGGSIHYGYLYNWKAVMHNSSGSQSNPSGVQGICPTGWHVPSKAEWNQLVDYVRSQNQYLCNDNSDSYIGKALADTTGWISGESPCAVGNDQSSNNSTGFSALPAGIYTSYGYNQFGRQAMFWTSTEAPNGYVWYRHINYYFSNIYSGENLMFAGYSVRCLSDETGGGTAQTQPTAATEEATDITSTSATLNGTVSNPDNVTITAQGFEWKVTEGGNYTTVDASGESMSYNLTGLTANTGYSYRAFVTTAEGTSYGEEVSFTTTAAAAPQGGQPCPGTATVTDYDGNVYNTVQIGQQCWMKENLRTTRTPNGTIISGRYYPNNDSNNVAVYGYLYHWFAVMDGASSSSATPSGVQGICPTGWHVPSNEEWTELEIYLGSQSQYICNNDSYCIAKALASTTGWNSPDGICFCCVGNNQSSNNATGFDALPSGAYYFDSSISFGENAYYWSSTEGEGSIAWLFCLNNAEAEVIQNTYYKSNGLSVRCLRD